MKICQKCGTPMESDAIFCTICGTKAEAAVQQPHQDYQPPKPLQPEQNHQPQQGFQMQNKPATQKSVAAFVVGLIGAIFGIFGGMCVAACYSLSGMDGTALIMLVGGSILGLIGACMCLSKAKTGGLLELGGAILIAICAFSITGADFMTLAGMLMLAVGGLCGLLTK